MDSRIIEDEFTDLNVSRQRKWQLRKQKENLCEVCGKPAVVTKSKRRFCADHNEKASAYQMRYRGKTTRKNNSKYGKAGDAVE